MVDVADMRRRIAAEHPRPSPWDLKNRRGGLIDLEFIVQYLMLREAARSPQVLRRATAAALSALAAAGALSATGRARAGRGARIAAPGAGGADPDRRGRVAARGFAEPDAATLARCSGAIDFARLDADITAAAARVSTWYERLVDGAGAKHPARGGRTGRRKRIMSVEPGGKAPDFTLPTDGNGTVALSELAGKKVVLYFYPKDDTSGCTAEACGFRDSFPDYGGAGAVVIGISKDSVASHDKFKKKHGLPFILASDADGEVCEKYGTWVEKSMYGRKYMGIERATFLIDGAGIVRGVWHKVRVPGHVAEVLKAAQAL